MRLGVLAVHFAICWAILCAGCNEKEDTGGVSDSFPSAPAGLAFSIPRGELAFFRPGDGVITGHYLLADWPVTNAVINLQGSRLILADGSHSRVGVLTLPDLQELTNISLGGVPVDMQLSDDGNHAFVITHNSNLWDYIPGFDTADTLEIGADPRRIALRPPLHLQGWIACPGDSTVYIVNLQHMQVEDTLIYYAPPTAVAFSPDGVTAYIALAGSPGTVISVDAAGLYTYNIRVGGTGPFDIALSVDGRFVAAADSVVGRVRIWDVQAELQWDIPAGGRPGRIRYSPSCDAFFVSVPEYNRLLKIGIVGGIPTANGTIAFAPDLQEFAFWEHQ